MRFFIRLFCLLLFTGRLSPSVAQTPAYLHYGVQDGLPSNLVYCGLQDRQGLLWFGTDKGLACFDGTRFRTLGMKDGLPDPEVLNLMEDSERRLWISSYRKKPCYRQNGKFITERQDSLLAQTDVELALWEFYEDADHSVWLTGQSSLVMQLKNRQIYTAKLPKWVIRPGRIGETLFFFGVDVIYKNNPEGSYELVERLQLPLHLKANPFKGLAFSGNRVLYSFLNKLTLLEWRDGAFHEIATRQTPNGRVFTDNSGRFWVCSLAEGAFRFDNRQGDLSNPAHYFAGEKVTAMFEDRQGTYWFCTTDNGVYALPPNAAISFSEHNGLTSNNITALTRDAGGQIWAGDDEGNLYEFNPAGWFTKTAIGTQDGYNRFRRIIAAPNGDRWIVADEGIYRERGGRRREANINTSPKAALLKSGRLWYAASSGLYFMNENTLRRVEVSEGRYTAVSEDSEGYVWAGTNDGIYCQSDSFSLNWGDRYLPLKSRIVAIEKAGEHRLWIVTPENGPLLAQTQSGKIISLAIVNEQLKSPVENVQSIFQEPGGMFWMATNKGVYGISADNGYWKTVHFDHHNGLANDDVNAVLVHRDTLWAATVGGLSRIIIKSSGDKGDFPTFITRTSYQSENRTHALYTLDSVPSGRTLILPAGATLFEMELAGLDYRSRGNLRYQCVTSVGLLPWRYWTVDNLLTRLGKEFGSKPDTTWVETGNFSLGIKMQPGRYHFHITAATAGGIHSLQPDRLNVVMLPFWYETAWFWLLLWGAFFLGLWRFFSARSAYRKLDQAVSELQLRALQAQMNPHFVGNSINAIQQFFYPPDPVRASEYIALFTRLLRRTMVFSEQTFIPFSEELAYDRDYLEMMKLRLGDRFHFDINGAESVPPDMPFPSMLLQPILENATLHGLAPEGISVLKLHFSFDGKKLVCSVSDNGAGFRETRERQKIAGATRKSKGLEMLHQKAETLNRRYDLGLKLDLQDLSDTGPAERGSQATILFFPAKISLTDTK